jgi:hypothetical protein
VIVASWREFVNMISVTRTRTRRHSSPTRAWTSRTYTDATDAAWRKDYLMRRQPVIDVVNDVVHERFIQDMKWGEQNHPDGTGKPAQKALANIAQDHCDREARNGSVTWADIMYEEFAEALAESDEDKLREELIQTAAVAIAWVESIDRRRNA